MSDPIKLGPLTSVEQLMAELRKALLEREQFRLMVQSVVDYAIYMLDSTGRVATWNRGAERLKGYHESEIIGQSYDVFFMPEDRKNCLPDKLLRRALKEGHVQDQGWRLRKDGTRFWADVTITTLYDEEGQVFGFTKITRDLTEREVAERSALNQEERYRMLVESVTDYAVYMLDPTGIITTWNKGAEAHKGYTEAEILGQHFSRFYTPQDVAAGLPQRLLDTAAREGRVEHEGWRVRKDGTQFWADVVITAIRDKNDALIGFSKVTRDLTERKAAEDQLRQFELLVKNVVDYAIYLLDTEGHIKSWNKGAEAFKGYTESDILGESFTRFYTPEDQARGLPMKLLGIARQEGHVEQQGWRVRKDGSRFWADVVITAIRNPQGQLTGFAKITRDLTEQKRADSLKDEFLSILSHELRTPINAIMGFGSILEDGLAGPLSDTQQNYLRKMLSGADTLLSLVNDLLDMSRIQAGKFGLHPSRVMVPAIVESNLGTLQPLAEQKNQRLINLVPGDLPPVIADGQRIGQVVINLVNNAIKFSPPATDIVVTACLKGEMIRCEVKDHGPGIRHEDLDLIFKRFTQLDMGPTRPAGGTGLGLSITKALVEAHGGQVGVDSVVGEGSTFWFTLPLVAKSPTAGSTTVPA